MSRRRDPQRQYRILLSQESILKSLVRRLTFNSSTSRQQTVLADVALTAYHATKLEERNRSEIRPLEWEESV
jgi:hypothetical protein